jgi:glycosyltransferase involved in cell wall biosynthesis
MSDCTINIANNEGFGLSTLESLSCGKPIICTKTGGLTEQVEYEGGPVGFGIKPESQMYAGSQQISWILEDGITKSAFLKAMIDFYNLSQEERDVMGRNGCEHVLKNYNFQRYGQRWVEIMEEVHEKHGSWDTRKNYNPVYFKKF